MRTVCGSKALNKFQTFEGSFSLLILDKKQLTCKISNERRVVMASVVGLDNLSSNLRIIILRLITKLIFKYKFL